MLANVRKSNSISFFVGKSITDRDEHGGITTDQHASGEAPKISDYNDIHHFICEKLAEIRLTSIDVLEQEMVSNGGDLDIDSEEGASVAYGLEGAIGRKLVGSQDIKRENFTSIKRLSDLLHRNMLKSLKKGTQK
jgi:hypothetical protein